MGIFKSSWRLVVIGLFLIAIPVVVLAKGPAEQAIYVGPNDIIDGNFIRVGNIIEIAGAVNGDVIVAGNSVTISGPVAGDVIVAGNTVRISGAVGGSVRAVGSTIDVNSTVARNAWLVAGTTVLGDQSAVAWDIYAATGSLEVKGPVGGNVWAGAGSVVLGSKIGKDVIASVDQQGQIILNPTAAVGGKLEYHAASDEQLIVRDGAVVAGETVRKPLAQKPHAGWALGGAYLLFKTFSFFGLLVIGLLLISLAPKYLIKINDTMIERPMPSIGWGVVYFFLLPIAVVFLFITVIGIPLAIILIPVYLISLYLAKLLVGFAVGVWVFNRLTKSKYKGSLIWPLIVGLLIVIVVVSIPVLGWLAGLVALWWALGALLQVKKEMLKDWR